DRTVTSTGFEHDIFIEHTDDTERVRQLAEFGADLETRATRVYALGGAGGFDALLHSIEPRVHYIRVLGKNLYSLPIWDERVDRVPEASWLEYSVTNRLRGRTVSPEGTEPVRQELARFTVAHAYDIEGRRWGNLAGDLTVQPGLGRDPGHVRPGPPAPRAGHRELPPGEHCRGGLEEPYPPRQHELRRAHGHLRREPIRRRLQVPVLGARGRVHQPEPRVRRQDGRQRVPLLAQPARRRRRAVDAARCERVRSPPQVIPFIDLTRQHAGLRTELLAAMARVLDRSQFILGDEGRALEHEVAVACGVRH